MNCRTYEIAVAGASINNKTMKNTVIVILLSAAWLVLPVEAQFGGLIKKLNPLAGEESASPQYLIYSGKVDLVAGDATVNIDVENEMIEGTFVLLCRNVQSFTTNESGWTAVRSSVSGNTLTIEA